MVDPEFVKLCHGQISHENTVCILFDSSKSINIEIVKFPVEVRSGYDHNFVIWPSNLAATISLISYFLLKQGVVILLLRPKDLFSQKRALCSYFKR